MARTRKVTRESEAVRTVNASPLDDKARSGAEPESKSLDELAPQDVCWQSASVVRQREARTACVLQRPAHQQTEGETPPFAGVVATLASGGNGEQRRRAEGRQEWFARRRTPVVGLPQAKAGGSSLLALPRDLLA